MAGLRLLRRPERARRPERGLHLLARIARLRRSTSRFLWDHRGALMLAVILVIAALPRMWAILGVGFRGDEAVYAGQAAVLAGDDELDRYFVLASRGNSNFLFYQQVVALLYLIFGVSDVAARLVSIGFSLGTVLVCFELGRTLYSRNVGLLGAAFFAVSGYSVMLGRLALLDSTFVFLFSLCFLFFAKWITSRRDVWLYGFAATFAMTLQCKVTGVLVIVIAVNYLLVSRQLRVLSVRRFLMASLAFLVFFIPVLVQIALKSDQLLEFLSDSGARATHVPWYYYLDKLIAFEGYLIPAVWLVGLALAMRRWTTGDRLLVFWAFVVLLFFHVYPLKAFNYLLPLIPALSILAGRGVHDVALAAAVRWKRLRRRSRVARAAGAGVAQPVAILAAFGVVAVLAMPVVEVARTDSYFGLREAALWLKSNSSPQDGVMTLSKGSAQYALSFYARRDAYPYGRFRLATIFPGGEVRSPRPSPDGRPSADWVTYWPPRLIRNRKVSYLVYYTDEGDDPPENPLVDNEHQERFRRFIESYGGKLMHVVYRNHEGRAWIYKVTKLHVRPKIRYELGPRRLTIRGKGFRFNSRVTLYYHQKWRGTFHADANGEFRARIPIPYYVNPRYFLIATDNFGNYASTVGLEPTLRNRRARRRLARSTQGSGVQPKTNRSSRAPAERGRLAVKVDMADAVQVGSELPMRVRVNSKSEDLAPIAQSRVFFRIRSLDGKTPVRSRQRTTNTLGVAYMHLAALELPGFYKLSVIASKGRQRGVVTRTFKVRRR
jgi:4-amino-4-deoxy-L-arabinose transferase-like glycosyltransferase